MKAFSKEGWPGEEGIVVPKERGFPLFKRTQKGGGSGNSWVSKKGLGDNLGEKKEGYYLNLKIVWNLRALTRPL